MALTHPKNLPPAQVPVTALIRQMNELIEIMLAEPDLVLARKFAEHKALLKRKQKLTLDYRASIKSFAAQPDLIKQIPNESMLKLKAVSQKLSETAERNARTLRASITAVQRLIQNIIAHVKSQVLVRPGYKNPKTAYLELGTYSPTCKPVVARRSV